MSERGRLTTLFLAMAALLISSFALSHSLGRTVVRATDEVLARHAWANQLAELFASVREAESGQRGYVITGRESYLGPYRDAKARLDSLLVAIDSDLTTGPAFATALGELKKLVAAKTNELAATIELRRARGFEAAAKVIDTDDGMNAMHAVRDQVKRLNELNEIELDRQRWEVRTATQRRDFGRVAITLIDLLFLLGVYRRIIRDRNAKDAANHEILRQKELLSVTLSSIGDAVMVTDTREIITFVNPVAERLLKRSAGDCVGRPCGEVFKIISEDTRQPVVSPVTRVIENGHTAGLANHTLLVRPDGSEVSIDDAGSPVREADGRLHGVVLIFRDFTAHREAARNLQQANAALEAAVAAKDQFVAMISHELRTPLTPVIGTLVAWADHPAFPAAFAEEMKLARWNVELEARLIDDLLDMSRIAHGKLSIKPERVDLHETLRSVVTMFEREFAEKRLQITLELDAARAFASADTARMHQVFWNILKNAAKFTPRGGSINVCTESDDSSVRIYFRDSGIGMSAQTLEKIFEPLEQGGAEITQRFGGLGLGMAISKSLIEAQGGTLIAQSHGIGTGSTFVVTLPAVSAPEVAVAAPPAEGPRPVRTLSILLVEDHADTAAVIRLLLQRAGHRVEVADTVASGLSTLAGGRFDLILSDLGLPDGNGIDLIKQLRADSQIPAIALTGYGMDDDIARCKAAGFDRHLTKPINFTLLAAMMRELLP